jgi:two-component system, OmpR family, phosphate regulon sensor histidine kinase PhoR
MIKPDTRLLELIEVPVLLLKKGQVAFANLAAQSLLGDYIVGQDLRIAIRNPAAIALVNHGQGGRIRVDGLSLADSVWEMTSHLIDDDMQLITLMDMSASAGIARAHADFVANASHELRTPLATILGYVETLADPKAGGDTQTRLRFLGIVKREAERMQALIADLMSLSRIEAGKHEVPDDRIDLVALARETVSVVRENAIFSVNANVSEAWIAGDHGQIAQVLTNLVDNAVKYGKLGGSVLIQIELAPGGWVSLAVHDEGEGIAPEHLPRLTERFYRADSSRSREAGGTGLGLSIVKHIVERHRGRFDITSRPGQGTIATIMFKVAGD